MLNLRKMSEFFRFFVGFEDAEINFGNYRRFFYYVEEEEEEEDEFVSLFFLMSRCSVECFLSILI